MVRNNIEADVKVKCIETGITQAMTNYAAQMQMAQIAGGFAKRTLKA